MYTVNVPYIDVQAGVKHGNPADNQVEKSGHPPAILGVRMPLILYTDGNHSQWVHVRSGVPQGTVLGPLLFLAYINNLPDIISSEVRLFTDDCWVYLLGRYKWGKFRCSPTRHRKLVTPLDPIVVLWEKSVL